MGARYGSKVRKMDRKLLYGRALSDSAQQEVGFGGRAHRAATWRVKMGARSSLLST